MRRHAHSDHVHSEAGRSAWRFWVLWVVATNCGFFPGLAVGQALAQSLSEPFASGVVGFSFAVPVGLLQWLVLRRRFAGYAGCAGWGPATSVGWALGGFAGAAALLRLAPAVAPGGLVWALMLGFLGGAAVGIGQLPFIRRAHPRMAPWWVLVSAVAWSVFFPGAVTGFVLARVPGTRSD